MSVEIHDKLIALLGEVDELKSGEARLKSEKQRHLDLITASNCEIDRCNGELREIRENQLRLRREMDSLRDELFRREDDEVIVQDEAHVVTEDGASPESEGHRLWKDRQSHLRKVQ